MISSRSGRACAVYDWEGTHEDFEGRHPERRVRRFWPASGPTVAELDRRLVPPELRATYRRRERLIHRMLEIFGRLP